MPDERELTEGDAGETRWNGCTLDAVSSPDDLFRALGNPKRRRVLGYLFGRGEATFEELVDVLVGWVASEGVVVGPDERRRLEIELYHDHLPLLADSGLVSYDSEVVVPRVSRDFRVAGHDGDDRQKCALVAEQRGPGEFYGTWTYDPSLVDSAFEAVS